MLDDTKIHGLSQIFKRIFSMPISRLTFREIQSAIMTAAEGDKEEARIFLEALLSGSQEGGVSQYTGPKSPALADLTKDYGVLAWVAKDIFEKADFINFISSDIHTQPNRIFFTHSLRKVDGKEFEFFTDAASTIQLLQHFLNRVHELSKTENRVISTYKKELSQLKKTLDKLLED